jgi:hypothetical protein
VWREEGEAEHDLDFTRQVPQPLSRSFTEPAFREAPSCPCMGLTDNRRPRGLLLATASFLPIRSAYDIGRHILTLSSISQRDREISADEAYSPCHDLWDVQRERFGYDWAAKRRGVDSILPRFAHEGVVQVKDESTA